MRNAEADLNCRALKRVLDAAPAWKRVSLFGNASFNNVVRSSEKHKVAPKRVVVRGALEKARL